MPTFLPYKALFRPEQLDGASGPRKLQEWADLEGGSAVFDRVRNQEPPEDGWD